MNGSGIRLVIVFVLANTLGAWRSFIIDFTSYRCELNMDYVSHHDVKLIKDNGHKAINGSVSFKRDLNNLHTNFYVVVPRPNENWTLINLTAVDACKVLEGSADTYGNLPSLVLEELRKSKKYFPKKCPIEKEKLIYFDNIFMDPEKFPPLMPDMSFKAYLAFSVDDVLIIENILEGTVQSKSAARKNKKSNIPKNEGTT